MSTTISPSFQFHLDNVKVGFNTVVCRSSRASTSRASRSTLKATRERSRAIGPDDQDQLRIARRYGAVALLHRAGSVRGIPDPPAYDIEAKPSDQSPVAYLPRPGAAVRRPTTRIAFCAYLLPRREAVWWACQCVRALIGRSRPKTTGCAGQPPRNGSASRRRTGDAAALEIGLPPTDGRRQHLGRARRRHGRAAR